MTDQGKSPTSHTVSDSGCPNSQQNPSKTQSEWTQELLVRFWAKVTRRGPTDCWLWTGAVTGTGSVKHGQFNTGRRDGKQQNIKAHRFAWEVLRGGIPDGFQVNHHCDVPICCNPNHLYVGTQVDNLNDARRRGRLIDGKHLIKVDDLGLADILTNYRPGQNGKQLAAKYAISLVSLCRIVNGTQRVKRRKVAVFERVAFVHLPIRGEVA